MLKLDRQFGLYVIREPLAMGSSKACCRAEDPFFDRDVVLKLIGPEEVGTRENLDRLGPYLESLASLEHPAIAPVYDSGLEGDICYFTTAYYPNGCLADQLKQPMEIGKGLRVILQLSSALAYAYNEGFEQGKLTLKDVFLSTDGHAVIADFGIAATMTRLKQKGSLAIPASKGLSVETLHCLGEILIKLLLGPGAKPDSISTTLLGQSHGKPIVNLATDLLGFSEPEIHNFDDLLERLMGLAVLGSEVGINDYVEYVDQTNSTNLSITNSANKPAITPAQRQLEIKEAVYAKGEIRRLVAEKNKLQEILQRAINYKKHAEQKIAEGANALNEAKRAEAKALVDTKLALEQLSVDRPNHWHPALWLAGGVLAGSLITGGYNYLRLSNHQLQLQAQIPVQQTTPAVAIITPPNPALLPVQDQTVPNQPEIMPVANTVVTPEPIQEKAKLWWPAGNEFDPTAAVPVAMAVKVERLAITDAPSLKSTLENRQTAPFGTSAGLSEETQPGILTTVENAKPWWPAGNEFDSPEGYSAESCQDVTCVVQNWAKAWSNKDLDSYFSFYSEDYRPEPGSSLDEWRSMRLDRLSRPQWIKVMIEDLQVRSIGEDRVQIKLKQIYSSDYYQDQILKSLNLVKENGQWRILTERSLGALSPVNGSDMVGG